MCYPGILEQEPDGGYVANVPALPGFVSQGDTRHEALSNIQEAITLYVADSRAAGDPVPSEAGKEFVDIDAALARTPVAQIDDPQFKPGHFMLRRRTVPAQTFTASRASCRRALG
jgi:predicted RNase H-like HicB family nuclease